MKHRIVSLLPAATQMLIDLGAADLLVGVTHECPRSGYDAPVVCSSSVDAENWSMRRIHKSVRDAIRQGDSLYKIDEEAIAAAAPTLILTQGLCPVCAATKDDISRASCPRVLTLTPHSLADVAQDIRTVGETIDLADAGKALADSFLARIRAAGEKSSLQPRPRVLVLEWFDPLWISGEWIPEMILAAGGEPVLLGAQDPSREATWDEVAAADPDAILLAACSMDVLRARKELPSLYQSDDWNALRAVTENRVALLDGARHFSAPGPGLAEGVEVTSEVLKALLEDTKISSSLCTVAETCNSFLEATKN